MMTAFNDDVVEPLHTYTWSQMSKKDEQGVNLKEDDDTPSAQFDQTISKITARLLTYRYSNDENAFGTFFWDIMWKYFFKKSVWFL